MIIHLSPYFACAFRALLIHCKLSIFEMKALCSISEINDISNLQHRDEGQISH